MDDMMNTALFGAGLFGAGIGIVIATFIEEFGLSRKGKTSLVLAVGLAIVGGYLMG